MPTKSYDMPQVDVIGYRLPSTTINWGSSRFGLSGSGAVGRGSRSAGILFDSAWVGSVAENELEAAPTPSPPAKRPPEPEQPIPEVIVPAAKPKPQAPTVVATPTYAATSLNWIAPATGTRIGAGKPRPRTTPKPRPRPRRSKPAPKPSRRARPGSTPRPSTPRIRIPVPSWLRAAGGRLLGVASLTPAYLALLAAVSDKATRQMYERMYGVPYDDRDDDNSGRGDAFTSAPRDRGDFGELSPFPDEQPLPEVRVTGRAPSRVPIAEPLLIPIEDLGVGFDPRPITAPEEAPERSPTPRRVNEPAPRPRPSPTPGLAPSPAVEPAPAPAPEPSPVTSPVPRPDLMPEPGIFPSPFAPPSLMPRPLELPQPQPTPQEATDCDCGDGKKGKKRKKKQPRTECWKGEFTEKATSLRKLKKLRVDCKTGEVISGLVDERGNPIS